MNTVRSCSSHNVFLHPGEFHFGPSPGQIGTLLGSCVALTVWHPQTRCGGMCHILLPSRVRPHGAIADCRYAWEAVERFALEIRRRGIEPEACRVHLYGGGNMFQGTSAEGMNVGQRNLEATRAAIAAFGFSTAFEHVGGFEPRRLAFDLATGQVKVAVTKRPQTAGGGTN